MNLCDRISSKLARGIVMLGVLGSFAVPFHVFAESDGVSARTDVPQTPHDFAALYGAASASHSAEAVASFYGDVVISFAHTGTMRTMAGKEQQVAELAAFYDGLKKRGITSLRLTDYTITELSNEFATSRMRWELADADGNVKNTVLSTYVIRRELPGWRVVSILEMGAPRPPAQP